MERIFILSYVYTLILRYAGFSWLWSNTVLICYLDIKNCQVLTLWEYSLLVTLTILYEWSGKHFIVYFAYGLFFSCSLINPIYSRAMLPKEVAQGAGVVQHR